MTPVAYVADAAAIAQTVRDLIEAARSSIVLQMYMFAGNGETEMLHRREGCFAYAHTVARWLVERRARSPELAIAVVLDTQTIDRVELTRNREGVLAREVLERAGIPTLHANLFGTVFDATRRFPTGARFHDHWRDVDPTAFGRAQQRWQTWHNVEDHRKNLVIDEGAWGAVTSHNFLDVASDWHENLFLVGAPAAGRLWEFARRSLVSALELPQRLSTHARTTVASLVQRTTQTTQSPQSQESSQSPEIFRAAPKIPLGALGALRAPGCLGADLPRAPIEQALSDLGDPTARADSLSANVQVLDTREIRPRLIEALAASGTGDRVRAASTWFSDAELLDAFAAAADRGADVELLTDDLYGLPLPTVPAWFVRRLANLRVIDRAAELARPGFALRIHRSARGRMMHLKTAAFLRRDRRFVIGGQANYTPNSFSGAWLETGLVIEAEHVVDGFLAQFEALWRGATPPEPASPIVRETRRALMSLVEKTVFRF